MNMYLHELKALRRSTLIWTCVLIAVAAIYFSVYPGIAKDAADFKSLMAGYPASVRAMLGISLDSITSLLGFYSFVFTFIMLCGAIQAMISGVSILSKEARERTADFLLVKPVSRSKIVTSKLLAALTMLLVTNLLYFAGVSFLANMVKTADFNGKLFLMVNVTLLFVQMIFFAVGLVISVFFKKLKSVLPISLGVVFGFYILGALLVTNDNDLTRYFFPFKYFNFQYILSNARYETPYLAAGAAIFLVAIAASYFIFRNKDIHAAT